MNESFEILSYHSTKKKTRRAIEKISKIIKDLPTEKSLAALIQVLVDEHVLAHAWVDKKTECICRRHANERLTEILQTIRAVHDNAIESLDFKDKCACDEE